MMIRRRKNVEHQEVSNFINLYKDLRNQEKNKITSKRKY
jgi:hypothetical protein